MLFVSVSAEIVRDGKETLEKTYNVVTTWLEKTLQHTTTTTTTTILQPLYRTTWISRHPN